MTLDLDFDTPLMAAPDHTFCELGGEAVILSLGSGTYFGLNALGTRVWQLLQQPRSLGEVRKIVTQEFDVTPERCESDLLAFVASLRANGLLSSFDAARS